MAGYNIPTLADAAMGLDVALCGSRKGGKVWWISVGGRKQDACCREQTTVAGRVRFRV